MLNKVERYCFGYLATAIIEACREYDVFSILNSNEFKTTSELRKMSNINDGYLSLLVQTLQVVGCVEKNAENSYKLSDSGCENFFVDDISSLYKFKPQEFFNDKAASKLLKKAIRHVIDNRHNHASSHLDIIEGAVIVTVILAMSTSSSQYFTKILKEFDCELAEAIEELFMQEKWLKSDRETLSEDGNTLLESSACRLAGSFREKILSISDSEQIFDNEEETYKVFLDALKNEITNELNDQERTKKVNIVVNLGDQFKSFITDLNNSIVKQHSKMGYDDKKPLCFVSVYEGKSARKEIKSSSEDVSYSRLYLNGEDNSCFANTLMANGYSLDDDSIYIETLGNLNLSGDGKKTSNEMFDILSQEQSTVYMNSKGALMSARNVLSLWYEKLKIHANTINSSRFFILAEHRVPGYESKKNSLELEHAYFNCIDGLSGKNNITAEAFLILAASVGLFNRKTVKRYPESASYCRMTLHNLEKRDYLIRHAVKDDLTRLYELEELCWQHTRTPKQQIRARLKNYPQGNFVLEMSGKVLGVIYSQRIDCSDKLESCNAKNVHKIHQANGEIIQLLAVNVDPQVQNLNLGDQLLEFMLQRCSLVSNVNQVVAVTLCKSFNSSHDIAFDEYIHIKGSEQDPVLAFHDAHGAEIVKPITNYREQDIANNKFGVLVRYDIHFRVSACQTKIEKRTNDNSSANAIAEQPEYTSADVDQIVKLNVSKLLNVDEDKLETSHPMMEMGMDSADLLKLQKLLEEWCHLKLKAGFFFEYNTIDKITIFLTEILAHKNDELDTEQQNTEKQNTKNQDTESKSIEKVVDEKNRAQQSSNNRISDSKLTNLSSIPNIGNTNSNQQLVNGDIAVVGMSCKLPGHVENTEQLWDILSASKNVISQFPSVRGEWPSNENRPGIEFGGFIDRADAFDAGFFRVSPAEALITDPQQRILLELTWSCFEDANLLPESFKESQTGVFIGASNCDYSRLIQASNLEAQPHFATGSSLAILANRLSYFFDLSGPSLLIDTACSSSLVAMHMAIQSLRSGESSAALVGGVNLICHPDLSIAYQRAGMLSADGQCKTFDQNANGYVRSEGAVMFLLKPLPDAILNNDKVHAVLKGSAINHGGLAGGLTVPNPRKQSELLTSAWNNAGVSPRQISYIEAHGTGTPLGDPIEIQGIQYAFSQQAVENSDKDCKIGSVKSNLGHLEAAAGITGVLKVILSMQHKTIPASINFEVLNPKISFEGTPFSIAKLDNWSGSEPRIAGVSSFGSGGANAHVVVEEWVTESETATQMASNVFVLSARSKQCLTDYVESILYWIKANSVKANFTDFIYTFQMARTVMSEKLAIHATDFSHLKQQLERWRDEDSNSDSHCNYQIWQSNTVHLSQEFERLRQGDSLVNTIKSTYSTKDLNQLALLWCSNIKMDFGRLYNELPTCISVPSYPFIKQSFWLTKKLATSPTSENTSIIGEELKSLQGASFTKIWNGLPSQFIFSQNDFTCYSLGFILELLLTVGDKVSSELPVTSILDLKFYPYQIIESDRIKIEIGCQHRNQETIVEVTEIYEKDTRLIAQARIVRSDKNENSLNYVEMNGRTKWIDSDKRESHLHNLPVLTLNSIFPSLLGDSTSPEVSIDKISFHSSRALNESLLIGFNSNEITLFTQSKQPVLSFTNTSAS